MNWKATVALATACVGIGAYAYFVEAKKDAPLSNESQEVRLWNLKSDPSITRVSFEDAEGHHAEYAKRKDHDEWYYAPRASDSLETFNWDNHYNNLVNLVAERKIESTGSLLDFGLDKPSLKVTMGDAAQPARYNLKVGGKNALDASTCYLQVNQDRAVYVLADWKVEGWKKLAVAPPIASPSPSPAPVASNSASSKP